MQLSSLQLSSLLDEIASMVAARRPIAVGLRELHSHSLGRIGIAAKQLTKQLDAGESPENAIVSISGRFAPMTQMALRCVAKAGTAKPVYHLAAVLRLSHERQTRAAIARIYPALTLLVAYLVVSVALSTLLIELEKSKIVDLPILPWLVNASYFLQQYFWVPLVVLAALWSSVQLLHYVHPDGRRWTLPWLSRTEELSNWASFCDMLAIAIESGFAFDVAVELAGDMSGDPRWRQRLQPTIDAIRGGAVQLDAAARQLPPLLRWRMTQFVLGGGPVPSPEEIRTLARWYHLQGQRRWQFWSEWFPLLATISIMALLVLAMCLLVIKPLYDFS